MFSTFYTLLLFTRSDLKTILAPTTVFGTLAAPAATADQLLPRVLWVWAHLLQFCVSNQLIDPLEDATNKPWRPIPSGRISFRHAQLLRWLLVPLCAALSWYLGVPAAGCALALATLAHNELSLHSHWATRSAVNAAGYASFNSGAAGVICTGRCEFPPRSLAAQLFNALVVLTTIHAQDFADTEGDRASGRTTLPIAYPEASRASMALLVPLWSVFLSVYWSPGPAYAVALVALGSYVGLRYRTRRGSRADQVSYRTYNIWLCLVQATPFV